VVSELNVRDLETCADPLKYASLRAEPDWQVGWEVVGRRVGWRRPLDAVVSWRRREVDLEVGTRRSEGGRVDDPHCVASSAS
jgi:hypothetical protein